jgi:hypothetical protein
MEPDGVGVRLGEGSDGGGVGPLQLGGPRHPPVAVHVGDGAVGRELQQRLALLDEERVERGVTLEARERELERVALETPDGVTVDVAVRVQRAAERGEVIERCADVGRAGHVLDAEVDRVQEAPARRVVRRWLLRERRSRRVERAHGDDARAAPGRPLGEPAEIGQVADAPRLARTRRVQLQRPAPRAQALRQVAAAGADDQARRRTTVERRQLVVADGEIRRKRVDAAQDGAALERDVGRRAQELGVAGAHAPNGVRVGRARLLVGRSHRARHGLERVAIDVVPPAHGVPVAIVDVPGAEVHGGPLPPGARGDNRAPAQQ